VNASPTGSPDPSRQGILPGSGPVAGPVTPSSPKAGRRRWLAAVVVGAPLLLGGCTFYPSYWASTGATTQGKDTFKLWSSMMTIGIIVGGVVAILILWAIIRYRRRSDEMPRQFHENVPLEIIYTVLPIVIVGFLFFFTVLTENNVDATQPVNATTTAAGRPVVDITVTAFQWGWRFDYPGLNVGVAGETTNGPDNHGPQMVVPVGETVQITLVSDDVIHGFYVRDFNFSRYAQPGVTNIFDLNVVNAGTYDGQCTQFCGLYHSEMLFSVKAVTPTAFQGWVSSEVAGGHVLQNSGAGAANTPPPDTKTNPASAGASSASATPPATSKAKASA
jgi:cytochrome c oxidase subunit II